MTDIKDINTLLRRAIEDDGPEAVNAFTLMKKKFRKENLDVGKLYYFERERSNPLLSVVERKDQEIADLNHELDELWEEISYAEKKGERAPPFPWDRYRDLENQMCSEFANKQGSGRSFVSKWQKRFKAQGAPIQEGSIKQRLNNAPPPSILIDSPRSGPATWLELWYLGSKLDKRAWKSALFDDYWGIRNRHMGGPINDITQSMMDNLRAKIRSQQTETISLGETKNFVLRVVHDAGAKGISRQDLMNSDPTNKDNLAKRLTDLLNSGDVFRIGEAYFVHSAFKNYYKDDWKKAQDKLEEKREKRLMG
jgi:hypothetical protein